MSAAPADEDTTVTAPRLLPGDMRYLPGEIIDTVQFYNEMQAQQNQVDFYSTIHVLARSYGDSVVLRWAVTDHVAWRYLNRTGVSVSRIDLGSGDEVDLADGLRPASLDEWRARYSENDSVAGIAMGALYGQGLSEEQTQDEAGSIGSLYELSQEQQLQYGMALLASEWRQDVADRLAMRFVDRTAKRGHTYTYLVYPTQIDTLGNVLIRAGSKDSVRNERYKPQPFDVQLTDSIAFPDGVHLFWEDRQFSSYEVERRLQGSNEGWTRLNKHPYVVMNGLADAPCFYGDQVDRPGTYEYRVLAHDPFGDLTSPSLVHTVTINDMMPPVPPVLTWIEIDRRNESDPSKEVFATIHFQKDTLEADYVGAVPVYYHERITEGKWKPLVEKPLAPTDTMVTIDVTNLQTGQVAIAAYDTAQNVSYSIPQLLRVTDMRPPEAPQGLKAETSLQPVDSLDLPLGLIRLSWKPLDDEDIDYYEVIFANDSTHEFMTRKDGIVRGDTVFVDTVAVDVNQKYIYYKVRAVDYSTNMGEFSDMLQVIRPSAVPPPVAHLDSSYVDGKGIFMRWIAADDEQAAYHHVYRRLADSEQEWTLLRRCDGDSVKACNNYIDLTDVPRVNSNEEYVYAVETFNYSGISSGLSLQFLTRFTGDAVFDTPIRLFASYEQDKNQTRLVWEVDQLPEGKDWYYCIWRQGPDDDRFKFLLSAQPDDSSFTDFLMQPGQTAHYYVQIQMEDGRESEPSNIVTVKSPASAGQ